MESSCNREKRSNCELKFSGLLKRLETNNALRDYNRDIAIFDLREIVRNTSHLTCNLKNRLFSIRREERKRACIVIELLCVSFPSVFCLLHLRDLHRRNVDEGSGEFSFERYEFRSSTRHEFRLSFCITVRKMHRARHREIEAAKHLRHSYENFIQKQIFL